MDRTAEYTMCISFPFNKKTSYIYSENESLKKASINSAIQTIQLVISAHGFISMEMVMKLLEFRPTRHCPGINFTELQEYELSRDEINHTDVLSLYLSNDMRLRPLIRFKDVPDDDVRIDDRDIRKKEEPECQTGPKETSESEENGKTSSDIYRNN